MNLSALGKCHSLKEANNLSKSLLFFGIFSSCTLFSWLGFNQYQNEGLPYLIGSYFLLVYFINFEEIVIKFKKLDARAKVFLSVFSFAILISQVFHWRQLEHHINGLSFVIVTLLILSLKTIAPLLRALHFYLFFILLVILMLIFISPDYLIYMDEMNLDKKFILLSQSMILLSPIILLDLRTNGAEKVIFLVALSTVAYSFGQSQMMLLLIPSLCLVFFQHHTVSINKMILRICLFIFSLATCIFPYVYLKMSSFFQDQQDNLQGIYWSDLVAQLNEFKLFFTKTLFFGPQYIDMEFLAASPSQLLQNSFFEIGLVNFAFTNGLFFAAIVIAMFSLFIISSSRKIRHGSFLGPKSDQLFLKCFAINITGGMSLLIYGKPFWTTSIPGIAFWAAFLYCIAAQLYTSPVIKPSD